VPFLPLGPDPGSGIGLFRIPDTKAIFFELSDKFLGKKFYNSLTGSNFFLQHFKKKIIFNFMKFVTINKGMTHFVHPSLLLRFMEPGFGMGKKSGSGIRDKHPGSAKLVADTYV
jgi:hypothetical protein